MILQLPHPFHFATLLIVIEWWNYKRPNFSELHAVPRGETISSLPRYLDSHELAACVRTLQKLILEGFLTRYIYLVTTQVSSCTIFVFLLLHIRSSIIILKSHSSFSRFFLTYLPQLLDQYPDTFQQLDCLPFLILTRTHTAPVHVVKGGRRLLFWYATNTERKLIY